MRAVVIGGGVAGLSAAWELAERTGAEVVVLEASEVVGGKLRGETVAGIRVDVGAEAMLNRRPEGVALARAAGLEVVHPAVAGSHLWTGGEVRPLPRTLMGVPLDLPALRVSGVLSAESLRRIDQEPSLPPLRLDGDLSVGDLVSARFGDEVTDVLVEPLLGGVYAGHAREISARCAAPQLVALAEQGSLLEGVAGALPTAQPAAGPSAGDGADDEATGGAAEGAPVGPAAAPAAVPPVFAAVAGGMHRLPETLAASGRFEVQTGVTVRTLEHDEEGFQVVSDTGRTWTADVVVVAVPARPAGRLVSTLAPRAAQELEAFEAASVGVITLAYDAEQAAATSQVTQRGSGFLVPPTEGRRIKAATFSFAKWDQVRDAGRGKAPGGGDVLLLRASVGRHREEEALRLTDPELVELARAELAAAVGLGIEPMDAHVQRWQSGLPQYPVGHQDRVQRVRDAVAAVPGLALAGAAYDGVGIPATISSAHRAVDQVLTGRMGA